MKNRNPRGRMASLAVLAVVALAAPAATAANPQNPPSGTPALSWTLTSSISRVAVVDQSVQSTTLGTYMWIEFNFMGNVCGNSSVSNVYILRSDHPEQFDHWVRLANDAYLSGKRLSVVSAKRTTSSNCYTWYLQIRD